MEAGLHDQARFAAQIRHDRYRSTPANRLLTALRGKDVLLVFVESYGQFAVQGSSIAPRCRRHTLRPERTAERGRLLGPERLAHVADLRRHQLAGALHDAVGRVGRQRAGATTCS